MLNDTRPRYRYQLPSGDVVPVIRDHGDPADPVIDFQTRDGSIVKAQLLGPAVRLPIVHLNGSGRSGLYRQYQDAYLALLEACEAVQYAAPNQRDYYPLGDEAWREARKQHKDRLGRLQDVAQEIATIVGSLEA